MSKYARIVFVLVIIAICGYFLYVIFAGNNSSQQTNLSPQASPADQSGELDVVVAANPTSIRAAGKGATDLKNADKSTIEVTYHNKTNTELSGFQIQVLSGLSQDYRTGSTPTAKFNKEATAKNKVATYDIAPAKPGQSAAATVLIYGMEPGDMNFRVLVSTAEGHTITSPPVTIEVHN